MIYIDWTHDYPRPISRDAAKAPDRKMYLRQRTEGFRSWMDKNQDSMHEDHISLCNDLMDDMLSVAPAACLDLLAFIARLVEEKKENELTD